MWYDMFRFVNKLLRAQEHLIRTKTSAESALRYYTERAAVFREVGRHVDHKAWAARVSRWAAKDEEKCNQYRKLLTKWGYLPAEEEQQMQNDSEEDFRGDGEGDEGDEGDDNYQSDMEGEGWSDGEQEQSEEVDYDIYDESMYN